MSNRTGGTTTTLGITDVNRKWNPIIITMTWSNGQDEDKVVKTRIDRIMIDD